MNDNDIINAWEHCVDVGDCATCEHKFSCIDLPQEALDLIKRQKTEINKLKLTYSLKIGEVQEHYRNQIGKARANAIKEFTAKIKTHKRRLCGNEYGGLYWDQAVLVDDIDRVMKEMTEGEDGQ